MGSKTTSKTYCLSFVYHPSSLVSDSTPFHPPFSSISQGHLEIADQLLSAGASVTSQDRSGRAALHHAADGRSDVLVRRLVTAGAPLEQTDSEGWTPLMRAVMLGGKWGGGQSTTLVATEFFTC